MMWSRGLLGALLIASSAAVSRAQTHLLIVSGLGGESAYSAQFRRWATTLADAARNRYALPDSDVVVLTEDGAGPRVSGKSTAENVRAALDRLLRRASPTDRLIVVAIGHGSGEGAESRIGIPGPDLSADDSAKLLARWNGHAVAFVALASGSGDFLPVLAAPGRVVITATKSSFERNASVFGGFFVDALASDGADTDKDGRVSLLEAFRYAVAETRRHYDRAENLQTEHPQLDDMGAREGAADPDGRSGEGMLASRITLAPTRYVGLAGAADPRLAALYADKSSLEDRIAALKQRKASMTADAFDGALEPLLVDLALKDREIRRLEGGKP